MNFLGNLFSRGMLKIIISLNLDKVYCCFLLCFKFVLMFYILRMKLKKVFKNLSVNHKI